MSSSFHFTFKNNSKEVISIDEDGIVIINPEATTNDLKIALEKCMKLNLEYQKKLRKQDKF